MDESQNPNETLRLATHASSPLPAWLELSRPMTERKWALREAMRPAHPQVRANILGLLATRYPVSNTTDAATLEAQCRLLGDDLDDLPESVLRSACREAARSCKFMPLAAEIYAFAKPHMDKMRDDQRHMDAVGGTYRPAPIAAPTYADPTTDENKAALDYMLGRFASADKAEGIGKDGVDYTTGPIAPTLPAYSDASDELKRRRA